MTIKDQLIADMKEAMKAKDAGKLRLSVIRMVRSSIKNAEINLKRELSDEDVLDVIMKEVKMRRDSIEEFTKAKREDLLTAAKAELEILKGYLPAQLSEVEVRQLIQQAIETVKAETAKDMGKVMSFIKPQIQGRADGKKVSEIVKELLQKLQK